MCGHPPGHQAQRLRAAAVGLRRGPVRVAGLGLASSFAAPSPTPPPRPRERRYENALSIVVPYFATEISASGFVRASASFAFSRDGSWREVTGRDLVPLLEVTP